MIVNIKIALVLITNQLGKSLIIISISNNFMNLFEFFT